MTASLGLSSCATQRTIVSGSSVTIVSPDLAFASLGPGTPAVLSIVQTTYANATRQTMALATTGTTPGQNELRVDIFGTSNDSSGAETTLPDRPLREGELTSEAEAALPGVPLRRSLTYVQNQYGPFGYALGKRPQGDPCIYAWQRIATPPGDVSLFNRRATISLRLRLCQPNATETNLVAAMMGLHINASLSSGSWAQEPKKLSPDLGAAGTPMGPSPFSAAPVEMPNAKASNVRLRRPARVHERPNPVAPPPPAAPVENGVVIPPPPTGEPSPTAAPTVPPPPVVPVPAQGTQP